MLLVKKEKDSPSWEPPLAEVMFDTSETLQQVYEGNLLIQIWGPFLERPGNLLRPKSNSLNYDYCEVLPLLTYFRHKQTQNNSEFQSLKRFLIEDTKGFMSPKKFQELREMGPRICAKCMQGEVIGTFCHIFSYLSGCIQGLMSNLWHRIACSISKQCTHCCDEEP